MEFDIKKGHASKIEGDGLKDLMKSVLGNVKEENGALVASFGATTRFEVKMLSKTALSVVSTSDKGASLEAMKESNEKYNDFMLKATGFTAKERSKRLQKKAKEGKL
ncbi:MAG: DUF5611 family protein [Methanomassiliicoccus sp.]|nr:DUF5611 family protein [Methanomassiliicoccus sp.]